VFGPVTPGQYVTLHILDDDGVLFDASRQSVYTLNTTGTFIWCCLKEGLSMPDVARRLQATFGISADGAEDYLTSAIRCWSELGLINVAERALDEPEASDEDETPAVASVPRSGFTAGRPGADSHDYLLLDVGFRLRILTPSLRKEIELLLAPLSVSSI